MSPQRIPEKESGAQQPITPETEAYLRQTDFRYNTEKGMPNHPTPSPPSTVKFDETWPSTDHPSTLRLVNMSQFLSIWKVLIHRLVELFFKVFATTCNSTKRTFLY